MGMLIQNTHKYDPMKQLSRRQMRVCNNNHGLQKGSIRRFVLIKQQIYKSFFLSGNPAFMACLKKYANL